MGEALITRRGGSGGAGALDLKLIAVAAESDLPVSAKENTIAVIANMTIGLYMFSETKPTLRPDGAPLENGDLWIETGFTETTQKLNILKKNLVNIYPRRAFRFDGTNFIALPVFLFKNGAWKSFLFKFYYYGAMPYVNSGLSRVDGYGGSSFAVYDSYILFKADPDSSITVQFNEAIDFTPYKTMNINFSGSGHMYVYIDGGRVFSYSPATFNINVANYTGKHTLRFQVFSAGGAGWIQARFNYLTLE